MLWLSYCACDLYPAPLISHAVQLFMDCLDFTAFGNSVINRIENTVLAHTALLSPLKDWLNVAGGHLFIFLAVCRLTV